MDQNSEQIVRIFIVLGFSEGPEGHHRLRMRDHRTATFQPSTAMFARHCVTAMIVLCFEWSISVCRLGKPESGLPSLQQIESNSPIQHPSGRVSRNYGRTHFDLKDCACKALLFWYVRI